MKLKRWGRDRPPTARELEDILKKEGLAFYRWRDAAGTTYPWHTHTHGEVRWVISGSIKMCLRDEREIILNPGDRLDLPANTEHWAKVLSNEPVVYLCASKEKVD